MKTYQVTLTVKVADPAKLVESARESLDGYDEDDYPEGDPVINVLEFIFAGDWQAVDVAIGDLPGLSVDSWEAKEIT